MSGAVTKVCDIAGTVFNTTSRLKSLIEAVSVENVQPQAVFAAEALGFGIHVRDELLGQAAGVLSGNDNVRWDNLRILIGIRSGELHKTIRTSRPLLSFFLFVCACKVCFTDVDIGDLAFHMMAASGVIRQYPVPAFQLSDLVRSFSGHAEALAPASLMHALAVEIAQHSREGIQLYQRMNMPKLGGLLIRSFELLNDESVECITLLGGNDGLWLATFFSWLVEGKVYVSIDGKMLPDISADGQVSTYDAKSSKLRLELENSFNTGSYTENWIIRAWRKGQPTEFVVEEKLKNQSSQCQYMPLSMTKVFFSGLYSSQFQSQEALEIRADSMRGGLASALIVLLSRFGSLHEPVPGGNLDKSCTTLQLWDIFPEKWLKIYNSAITQYGWLELATIEAQKTALALLEPAFEKQADRLADRKQVWEKLEAIVSAFILSVLGNDYGEEEMEREDDIHRIFDPAAYVAVNAVATATCDFRSGVQRIAPPAEVRWGSAKDFFGSLLSREGMEISEFRAYSFAKALPGETLFDVNDVVVSSNGYIAGIYALWDFCSTQKRNALAIRVCTGAIMRENIRYDSIRESARDRGVDRFKKDNLEQIKLYEGTDYLGLYPKPDQDDLRVEHTIAEAGRRLELKSYLTASEEYINPVSWTLSIHGLAIAVHFEQKIGHTERQEKELAQAHAATLGEAYWQSFHEWGHEDLSDKTILKTARNQELRFFSCGMVLSVRKKYELNYDHKIVLRQSGSLMSSVLAAQDLCKSWIIIC